MAEELAIEDLDVDNTSTVRTNHVNNVNYLDMEGIPDPARQGDIISTIDAECTCTYAVSKIWYHKWEEYAGVAKNTVAGHSDSPGPLEMDTHNDSNNDYLNEEVWKLFVKWYGIAAHHQLDRKHLYFKDEKVFDICILSPFSGIVEHTVKKFNRFEEIGYIECQLRKMFHVTPCKKSRLWISEKAQVPRFRQLLLRFRMLNDCIHRDKVYILALEESLGNDSWPTGEPGEPKGDMNKYADLVYGFTAQDYWSQQVSDSLKQLTTTVTDSVQQSVNQFLQNGRAMLQEKEKSVEQTRYTLERKLEETEARDKFMEDKTKQVTKQEEVLKRDREELDLERQEFESREAKFKEELKQMESMHEIQESKIKLDIGGQIFSTSIQTLRRDADSMLAAMFSGRYELKREADGSYFIDRDGTFFRHILNFLRDGYLDSGTMPNDAVVLREILREAKFYQLGKLVQYLEELIKNSLDGSSGSSPRNGQV